MNKIKAYIQKKETLDTLKFVGILVLIYFIVTLSFTFLPFLNKYDSFAIKTDSMEPIINVGDVVITKYTDPRDIEIGDITAFYVDINNDGNDDVVVHYIDEISVIDSKLTFKTKPHVSTLQDSWTIEEHDIIGVYQFQLNNIGKLLLFLQSWVGRIIMLIDIIIISIVYDTLFGKNKNSNKETKEIKSKDPNQKKSI